MMDPRRLAVIGIDGLVPELTQRFMAEGRMPATSRMAEDGIFTDVLSYPPVLTPTNWTSFTTGTPPGVHGISGFWRHVWGERLGEFRQADAFDSQTPAAEPMWQTTSRGEMSSVLLKFPGSWPPTSTDLVQVDGHCDPAHGHSRFELAPSTCYSPRQLAGPSVTTTIRPATGWTDLPPSEQAPLMSELSVIPKERGASTTYYLLLVASAAQGYDRAVVVREHNAAEPIAEMAVGEWSPWITDTLGGVRGSFRFNLVELAADGADYRLYRSQMYPTQVPTQPPGLGEELVAEYGPFPEHISLAPFRWGWVDAATAEQEAVAQAQWIADVGEHLLTSLGWQFFLTHFHWVDFVQHDFLALVDPSSPLFDEANLDSNWELLARAYEIADSLIGSLLGSVGEEAVIGVVSDHGNVPDQRGVSLLTAFRQAGLIVDRAGGPGDEAEIDWTKTKAFPHKPGNLEAFVNLNGREPHGAVSPGRDYEAARDEIIGTLLSLRDPKTGKHPISLAVRREDAVPMGLWGEHVGDVVYQYAPGYTWSGHGGEDWDHVTEVFKDPTVEGSDYTSHHGPQPPTAATALCSNRATFIAHGPGVARGYSHDTDKRGPVPISSVMPTLATAAGLPIPKDATGAIVRDLLLDDES